MSSSYDLEKNPVEKAVDTDSTDKHTSATFVAEDGAVPGESFFVGDSYYAKAQRLAARFKIEARGIERVPEDERTDTGFRALLNVATMVSTYPCDQLSL